MRLLSRIEVLQRVGISRATWYRWRSSGKFPAPLTIGVGKLWREDDVDQWLRLNPTVPRVHRDP